MERKLLVVNDKSSAPALRKKTAPFDFSRHTKKEIRELIKTMRAMMKAENGVGLSANQIGLNESVFVAQVERKFYPLFNPRLIRTGKENEEVEEGCLSVPDCFGLVTRPAKIWLEAQDMNGRKVKIKAWGFLARVFQHEIDHLNGILFIDKAKGIRKIP